MAIQNNRLNLELDAATLTTLRTAFTTINTTLAPFAQALTTEERGTIPKMNVSNKAFVADVVVAVKNNTDFMPAYLSTDAIEKDYKLYEQLEEFLNIANSVCEKLSDTQMLAGSEAYSNALTAYRLFGAAAKAGLNGADSVHETLAERFKQTSTTTPATATNPPTT